MANLLQTTWEARVAWVGCVCSNDVNWQDTDCSGPGELKILRKSNEELVFTYLADGQMGGSGVMNLRTL